MQPLSTHQLALSNLKERCSSQQKRLDELEKERLYLRLENEDLASSLHKLDEENMELRERNLGITHQLKQSHYELLEAKRQIDNVGKMEPMSVSYENSPPSKYRYKCTITLQIKKKLA